MFKSKIFTILIISFVISLVGLILDTDPIKINKFILALEFILMTGILCILITTIYFSFKFISSKFRVYK